jgi:hypothetical protein
MGPLRARRGRASAIAGLRRNAKRPNPPLAARSGRETPCESRRRERTGGAALSGRARGKSIRTLPERGAVHRRRGKAKLGRREGGKSPLVHSAHREPKGEGGR